MTNETQPVTLTLKASTILNAVVDFFVGDLLKNKEVNKLIGYLMVTGGAIFHSSLGTTVAALVVGAGATVTGAHALKD
jgi:hypothetical protein